MVKLNEKLKQRYCLLHTLSLLVLGLFIIGLFSLVLFGIILKKNIETNLLFFIVFATIILSILLIVLAALLTYIESKIISQEKTKNSLSK